MGSITFSAGDDLIDRIKMLAETAGGNASIIIRDMIKMVIEDFEAAAPPRAKGSHPGIGSNVGRLAAERRSRAGRERIEVESEAFSL